MAYERKYRLQREDVEDRLIQLLQDTQGTEQAQLRTYVDETIRDFIMGAQDVENEETWTVFLSTYVEALERMHAVGGE